jgi:hypothetical protein
MTLWTRLRWRYKLAKIHVLVRLTLWLRGKRDKMEARKWLRYRRRRGRTTGNGGMAAGTLTMATGRATDTGHGRNGIAGTIITVWCGTAMAGKMSAMTIDDNGSSASRLAYRELYRGRLRIVIVSS